MSEQDPTPTQAEAPSEAQATSQPETQIETQPETQLEVQSEAQAAPAPDQPDAEPQAEEAKVESSEPDQAQPIAEMFPVARDGLSCIVTGATGAVGRALVGEVLTHGWSPVYTVGRRPITNEELHAAGFQDIDTKVAEEEGRLIQLNLSFDEIDSEASADVFQQIGHVPAHFCALGTTRKDAGSAAKFREVDYGYVSKMAEFSKQHNDLSHFSLVSSTGANPNSWFLYPKTKGEIEQFIVGLNFPTVDIWRPGLLGRQNKLRFVEKIGGWFMSSMPVTRVAQAMRLQAEDRIRNIAAAAPAPEPAAEGEEAKEAQGSEPAVSYHPNKSINSIVQAASQT